MTRDLARALEGRGIFLRRPGHAGEHRAPCPECDRGRRDDALAVRVEHDGSATWNCFRCGWRGAVRPEREQLHRRRPPQRPKIVEPAVASFAMATCVPIAARAEPEMHVTLSPWGLNLWDSCSSILPGTPAATYLEWRCCLVPPGDLRWHPDLEDKASGHRGPALVALVTDPLTCEPINLHRTWLAPDGRGKAPIDRPRRLLKGHRSKGVVRLWPDSEVTMGLTVGEGLETVLAAASEGLVPGWATISAHGLAEFPVLPGLEGLTILVDHDRPNPKTGRRAGTEAALALVGRHAKAGFDRLRDIRVVLPPTEGEDVADLVRQMRGRAA